MNTRILATAALAACLARPAWAAPPDFTGVWSAPFAVHSSGVPMLAGSTDWKPLSAGDPRHMHITTLADVQVIMDAMVKSGHRGGPNPGEPRPPLRLPALTQAGQAAIAQFDRAKDDKRDLNCYPNNVFLRLAGGLGSMQIVQNPKVIAVGTEINGDNFPRFIWMDGRSAANALPSWTGYSTGRWIGDTLHVETVKIKGGVVIFLDHNAWPISDNVKIIEDYRRIDGGKKLEIMQRLEDPTYYVEPQQRVSYLEVRSDLELHDYPCDEGREDQEAQ